jgi:hypothetical protein
MIQESDPKFACDPQWYDQVLQDVCARQSSCVLLRGGIQMGKTTLVGSLARDAERLHGAHVLQWSWPEMPLSLLQASARGSSVDTYFRLESMSSHGLGDLQIVIIDNIDDAVQNCRGLQQALLQCISERKSLPKNVCYVLTSCTPPLKPITPSSSGSRALRTFLSKVVDKEHTVPYPTENHVVAWVCACAPDCIGSEGAAREFAGRFAYDPLLISSQLQTLLLAKKQNHGHAQLVGVQEYDDGDHFLILRTTPKSMKISDPAAVLHMVDANVNKNVNKNVNRNVNNVNNKIDICMDAAMTALIVNAGAHGVLTEDERLDKVDYIGFDIAAAIMSGVSSILSSVSLDANAKNTTKTQKNTTTTPKTTNSKTTNSKTTNSKTTNSKTTQADDIATYCGILTPTVVTSLRDALVS